jgi:hypothetical protein
MDGYEEENSVSLPLSLVLMGGMRGKSVLRNTPRDLFEDQLFHALHLLSMSNVGFALLKQCADNGLSISIDPLLEADGLCFYPAQNKLELGYQMVALQGTHKGLAQYIVALCGGLRRAAHYYADNNSFPKGLKPEEYLKYWRCEEADIAAVSAYICWELRTQGYPYPWRQIISGTDADIAMIFMQAVDNNPRFQFCGTALRRAFYQWFENSMRLSGCDHDSLNRLDVWVQSKEKNKFSKGIVLRKDLEKLGSLSGGHNYLKNQLNVATLSRRTGDVFNDYHLMHLKSDLSGKEFVQDLSVSVITH